MHRTLFRPAPHCNKQLYPTLQACKNTLLNEAERPIDSRILQHMASEILQHIASQLSRCHQRLFSSGYCGTVQGLLDWFEVDLGFTELLFIQIDLCVMCVNLVCVST